jgi:hypothetical protein
MQIMICKLDHVTTFAFVLFFFTIVRSALVTPPSTGLGSDSNYFFQNNGDNIEQLSVTIAIEEDLVSENGWTVQLNGYSSQTDSLTWVWQQYSIGLDPNGVSFGGFICAWEDPSETNNFNDLLLSFQQGFNVTTLSESQIIPAGTQFFILLNNDDSGTITQATYAITINGQTFSGTIDMQDEVTLTGSTPTAAELAPIHAFTLNMVGWESCEQAVFSSGSGTISYSSTISSFFPVSVEPTNLGLISVASCETSNIVYGQLSDNAGSMFIQTFQVP